jgi:hypothetical protein
MAHRQLLPHFEPNIIDREAGDRYQAKPNEHIDQELIQVALHVALEALGKAEPICLGHASAEVFQASGVDVEEPADAKSRSAASPRGRAARRDGGRAAAWRTALGFCERRCARIEG